VAIFEAKSVNDITGTLLPNGTTTGDVVFEVEAGAKVKAVEIVKMPYISVFGG
jgi:hypothetical protein